MSGEGLWDTGVQEGSVGRPSRGTMGRVAGASRNLMYHVASVVPCNQSGLHMSPWASQGVGVVRFFVVEQDTPLMMPVGLMRTLCARLDLDRDGDKVALRRFGAEADLRTLDCPSTIHDEEIAKVPSVFSSRSRKRIFLFFLHEQLDIAHPLVCH